MEEKERVELMSAFYVAYLLGPEILLAAVWMACGEPQGPWMEKITEDCCGIVPDEVPRGEKLGQ